MKRILRRYAQGAYWVIYWLPLAWRFRPWDWAYTVDMLIHALEAQHSQFIDHKIASSWERQAREIAITIEALRRLRQDRDSLNHLEMIDDENGLLGKSLIVSSKSHLGTKKAVFDWENKRRKMFLAIFTTQLRRHLLSWWD